MIFDSLQANPRDKSSTVLALLKDSGPHADFLQNIHGTFRDGIDGEVYDYDLFWRVVGQSVATPLASGKLKKIALSEKLQALLAREVPPPAGAPQGYRVSGQQICEFLRG